MQHFHACLHLTASASVKKTTPNGVKTSPLKKTSGQRGGKVMKRGQRGAGRGNVRASPGPQGHGGPMGPPMGGPGGPIGPPMGGPPMGPPMMGPPMGPPMMGPDPFAMGMGPGGPPMQGGPARGGRGGGRRGGRGGPSGRGGQGMFPDAIFLVTFIYNGSDPSHYVARHSRK